MGAPVTYELDGGIATLTMDDGKVNVLSLEMLAALNAALDEAVADQAVVVLTGRPGLFSAGFDLAVLTAGGTAAADMLNGGFKLAERLLSFPTPTVIACPGHAIAMGVFVLLSADYRLGASGSFKIVANEVALGMSMPATAIEICRQRLAPACFNRAIILAETFSPESAVPAGFLDRVVPAADLMDSARATAADLAKLNMTAHAASKLHARAQSLSAIRTAIEADDAAMRAHL
ncbi:MAG: crotonase/enoyl-CoA hydratase family protein [Acidimicrobiales bacterium]|jgi:enoyl-CoA hydratase